jgi:ribose-phosphate pyrophosphokinase
MTHFPDTELSVEILDRLYDKEVLVVATSDSPVNENLMELLILIYALRSANAKRITVILPKFPYFRSNQKYTENTAILFNMVTNLILSSGVENIITIDLFTEHLECVSPYIKNVKSQSLISTELIKILSKKEEPVLVVSDVLDIKNAIVLSKILKIPFAGFMYKQRDPDNTRYQWSIFEGSLVGKTAIIYSNLVESGKTWCDCAEILYECGVNRILGVGVHPAFQSDTITKIENSRIDEVIVLNTVDIKYSFDGTKLKCISIIPLLKKVLEGYHDE